MGKRPAGSVMYDWKGRTVRAVQQTSTPHHTYTHTLNSQPFTHTHRWHGPAWECSPWGSVLCLFIRHSYNSSNLHILPVYTSSSVHPHNSVGPRLSHFFKPILHMLWACKTLNIPSQGWQYLCHCSQAKSATKKTKNAPFWKHDSLLFHNHSAEI